MIIILARSQDIALFAQAEIHEGRLPLGVFFSPDSQSLSEKPWRLVVDRASVNGRHLLTAHSIYFSVEGKPVELFN